MDMLWVLLLATALIAWQGSVFQIKYYTINIAVVIARIITAEVQNQLNVVTVCMATIVMVKLLLIIGVGKLPLRANM